MRSSTGAGGQEVTRRWGTARVAVLVAGAAFVVTSVLALLTLFDFTLVANYIAFLLAAVGHGVFAALLVGLCFEFLPRAPTRFPLGRVVGAFTMIAIGAGLYWLDRIVLQANLGAGWKAFYVAFLVAGLLVGGWRAERLFSRRADDGDVVRLAAYSFGATLGAATSIALLIALVFGLGAYRRSQLADADIDVGVITGIDGPYVALGDSYSAGEGLRPFQPGTGPVGDGGDDCHRSDDAYPQLLHFDDPAVTLEFRACSGAVTDDVFTGFRKHDGDTTIELAPQVDGVARPDVRLVTLSIGGNDLVFSSIVTHCFVRSNCIAAEFEPPDVDAEHPNLRFPEAAPLGRWAVAAAGILSARLRAVYDGVEEAFPQARIVVIGYPNLFPDDRERWRPDDCASVMRRVSRTERIGLRALTDELNDMIYAQAVAAGIEFVSPTAVWDDHESCGSEEEFTNSLTLVRPLGVDGSSYHPNRNGQRQLAALITCYLTVHPTPPDPWLEDPDGELAVGGFVELARLGLRPPPGAIGSPLACPA
jgi:hypothetical protein